MKKGFTLVELLTVIVIVSLLTLISIISIGKIVNKSKEDLYKEQLILIEKAAKSWAAENIDKLPEQDSCIYLTLKDLKNYGLLSDSVINPVSNEELDDDMKIKISNVKTEYTEDEIPTIKNEYEDYVIVYKVDSNGLSECRYMYGDYTLTTGTAFNQKIKDIVNGESNVVTDSMIKSIIFVHAGNLPNGVDTSTPIDLSLNNDDSVIGYVDGETIYVYSEGILKANSISSYMFYGLTALENVDLSGLDTKNVVNMNSMFENCTSLKYLNLNNFNTSNTRTMDSMFKNCISLRELNINSFSINRVNSNTGSHDDMFDGCEDLNIVVNSNIKTFITNQLTLDDVEVNLTVK